MRVRGLLLCALSLVVGAGSVAEARSLRHHRRHDVVYRSTLTVARAGVYAGAPLPPLGGTVGIAIPPEAARFMGYPYNVPGYRYAGYDGCLLRVGGPFGPGPSAAPCPFGLDGLY